MIIISWKRNDLLHFRLSCITLNGICIVYLSSLVFEASIVLSLSIPFHLFCLYAAVIFYYFAVWVVALHKDIIKTDLQ